MLKYLGIYLNWFRYIPNFFVTFFLYKNRPVFHVFSLFCVVFAVVFFEYFEWCVLLALLTCDISWHIWFKFDRDVCEVLVIIPLRSTCVDFVFVFFPCWVCVCDLSFLYLGMLILCGCLLTTCGTCVSYLGTFSYLGMSVVCWIVFFAGTCVCYLRFLYLGMSVVCLLVHSWTWRWIQLWSCCVYLSLFLVFLLVTTGLLEGCFCYLWKASVLKTSLTWACLKISCRLLISYMCHRCIHVHSILSSNSCNSSM